VRCFVLIVLAGCFSPQFGSPGFYCHEGDTPACPDGQKCINGQCYDENAAVPIHNGGNDGSGGMSTDDMGSSGWPGPDLSAGMSPPPDLSQPSPPPDLRSCVGTGGDCTYHKNSVCCSNYCIYSSNTCK
jgi:hypothetical protein